jgi:hypothetical protein
MPQAGCSSNPLADGQYPIFPKVADLLILRIAQNRSVVLIFEAIFCAKGPD